MRTCRMLRRMACLGVVSLLTGAGVSAAQPKDVLGFGPAKLSVDDLAAVYGLNIYKWNLPPTDTGKFRIILRERQAKDQPWKVLVSEGIRVFPDRSDPVKILAVSFTRRDGACGGVLFTDQKEADFRVRLCGERHSYTAVDATVPVPLYGRTGLGLTICGNVYGAFGSVPRDIDLLVLEPSSRVIRTEHPRAELVLQVITREMEVETLLAGDTLNGAAVRTLLDYDQAVRTGKESNREEIPSPYWAASIQALNPVRVYLHKGNVVVIQRVHEGVEEGKYICIPLSPYVPQSGDDGYRFTGSTSNATGYMTFDFRRTITARTDGSSSAPTASPTLGIYRLDTRELVLSDQDIAVYLGRTYEIQLSSTGIAKWNAAKSELGGKGFALRVGDKEAFRGRFVSPSSILAPDSIVILDVAASPRESDTLYVLCCSSRPLLGGPDDPRNHPAFLYFLAQAGKLK